MYGPPIAAVYLPGLSIVLHMVHPGLKGWFVIFGMSLIPLAIGQVLKGMGSIPYL